MKQILQRLHFLTVVFALCWSSGLSIAQTLKEQKLVASDANGADIFGDAVAISGRTIAIGAREVAVDSGAVYLFEEDSTGIWQEVLTITASDAATDDFFGDSVGLHSDTVLVGASRDDHTGTNSGSAYIFQRHHGGQDNWGEVKKLIASDAGPSDQFGKSLALHGDIAVVGAHLNDDAGNASGSVYIFQRHHGGQDNWGEVKKITASDAAADDDFGYSVSISGDAIVVGAPENDDAGAGSGAVYVFERHHGGPDNWGEVTKLIASDLESGDGFGFSVAVDSYSLVVGTPADDDAANNSGAAYVFERDSNGNWAQVDKLLASDSTDHDLLGISVSIDHDFIVVGASYVDEIGNGPGTAYLFARDEGGSAWGEVLRLAASDGATEDDFGYSVSLDGDTIIVGARLEDQEGFNAGAAYVFENLLAPIFYDDFESEEITAWSRSAP